MKFALKKYKLIYFTKSRRFNLSTGIQIGEIEKASAKEVHNSRHLGRPKAQVVSPLGQSAREIKQTNRGACTDNSLYLGSFLPTG